MARSTSDLILGAHQLLSLEAVEREEIAWLEEKEMAMYHVSFKRAVQLHHERQQEQQRRIELAALNRRKTVLKKLIALDGEEQKLRLGILKAEMLHLESVVRACSKAVRGEVFASAQDAQQRIKYFNKTLDIILKKESGQRRDMMSSERYEFLVLRQKCDKELTDAQLAEKLNKIRATKQSQHDAERRRQEENAAKRMSVAAPSELSQSQRRSAAASTRPSVADERQLTSARGRQGESSTSHTDNAATDGDRRIAEPQRREEATEPNVQAETAPLPPLENVSSSVPRSDPPSAGESDPATQTQPDPQSPAVGASGGADARQSSARIASSRSSSRSSSSRSHKSPRSRSSSASASSSRSSSAGGDADPPVQQRQFATNQQQQQRHRAKLVNQSAPETRRMVQPAENNLYQHVTPLVVVSHAPSFFERATTEIVNRENAKRQAIEADEVIAFQQLQRYVRYVRDNAEEREQQIVLLKQGGSADAIERCCLRANKRLMDEETKSRSDLVLQSEAAFESIIRRLNRVILEDHHSQERRMARFASHTNRIARKLQRLEAQRHQLSNAARESFGELHAMEVSTPNQADAGLASIGASQPYPATEPTGDTTLDAEFVTKLQDVELKRRKFVEREAMLRRMILQIYHRQKLKDFGFFDESKFREEQMRLAKNLADSEAAEAMRLLAALDERIAQAQHTSQHRLLFQGELDRLAHDESLARNRISASQLDEFQRVQLRHFRTLQSLHGRLENLLLAEELARRGLIEREQGKREALFDHHRRFRPLPPKKPMTPLPTPPPKFEDAIRVYSEFFKERGLASNKRSHPKKHPEGSLSVSPSTTLFSPESTAARSGRQYLPPPKKALPGTMAIVHPVSEKETTIAAFNAAHRASILACQPKPTPTLVRKPRPPPRDVAVTNAAIRSILEGANATQGRNRRSPQGGRLEPVTPAAATSTRQQDSGNRIPTKPKTGRGETGQAVTSAASSSRPSETSKTTVAEEQRTGAATSHHAEHTKSRSKTSGSAVTEERGQTEVGASANRRPSACSASFESNMSGSQEGENHAQHEGDRAQRSSSSSRGSSRGRPSSSSPNSHSPEATGTDGSSPRQRRRAPSSATDAASPPKNCDDSYRSDFDDQNAHQDEHEPHGTAGSSVIADPEASRARDESAAFVDDSGAVAAAAPPPAVANDHDSDEAAHEHPHPPPVAAGEEPSPMKSTTTDDYQQDQFEDEDS